VPDDKEKDWLGKSVVLTGEVEEYLSLDGRSWVKVRITDGNNGKCVMINTHYVKRVGEKKDDNADK
jgi:hypothetical protein